MLPRFMLYDLVPARYSQIDTALTDEGRNICCGEEYKGDWMVLYEGDVKARGAMEGDVSAGEEVEGGLLQATLCWPYQYMHEVGYRYAPRVVASFVHILLGTANRSRPSRLSMLLAAMSRKKTAGFALGWLTLLTD